LAIRQHFSIKIVLGTAIVQEETTAGREIGDSFVFKPFAFGTPLPSADWLFWQLIHPRATAAMPQHSSLNFWLLLTATGSVDAVAFYWLVSTPWPHYASMVYEALVVSQISVFCVWSALRPLKTWWSSLWPWLSVALATLANVIALVQSSSTTAAAVRALQPAADTFEDTTAADASQVYWGWIQLSLAQYLLHAALLMTVLWLFERTPFWRRRSAVAAQWRFSLRQLLAITTVLALLAATARNTYLANLEDSWTHFAFIGSWTVLAIAAVIAWNLAWHWLWRLATVMAASLLLGAAWVTVREFSSVFSLFITSYVIQGMVLSAWLGLGMTLPLKEFDPPT